MNPPGFFDLLLARDPRKLTGFPDLPLEKALADLKELATAWEESRKNPAPAASAEAMSGALSLLATNVWRARSKIIDPGTGQPRDEMRRVHRHVEGALEAFSQMGVRLNDWLNEPYDAGLPVKVLSFQPTPGLTRDTIVEVVRPAVFWEDRLLQSGEVVVGVPEHPTPASP